MRVYSVKLTLIVLMVGLFLSACAGSGGNSTQATGGINVQTLAGLEQLSIVAAMNDKISRVPVGFYDLERYESVEHDYLQVRSDHVIPNSTVAYDLSTNDPNQAFLWAQTEAARSYINRSFVSSSETPWFYENTWAINDPYSHHQLVSVRVFKSNMIDRSVYDANNPSPLQAVIQTLPVSDAYARFISEYLWTFSSSNNVGHVVISSNTTSTITGLRHRISEAVFDPAMLRGVCSKVQLWDLNYDISNQSGGVTLNRALQSEFQVSLGVDGRYNLCQDVPTQLATTDHGSLSVYPQ
ncbi:MAG: hypothetical protein Q9M20_05360 [Mariprofundaceae bacterium]|nr:hypothetical protein [Mariprofundaceae bacterium]